MRTSRLIFLLLLVTLALAPGLLANLLLKEHWHRPRPIDVAQFGGDEHFRPWWDPRGDCPKNCSFIAGEPTAAFWTMAAAAVVPAQWRALAYAAALTVVQFVLLVALTWAGNRLAGGDAGKVNAG